MKRMRVQMRGRHDTLDTQQQQPLSVGDCGCTGDSFIYSSGGGFVSEPTNFDLTNALDNAESCDRHYRGRTETRRALLKLRNKRTTWVGAEEYELRYEIDRYLRKHELIGDDDE